MKSFSEKKLVEDYILEKLKEKGWQFCPADELEREPRRAAFDPESHSHA